MNHAPVFQIRGRIQHYDWGKKGKKSFIAQLLPELDVKENLPYAELWMGVHPKGPSFLKDGSFLSDVLRKSPSLLGNYVMDKWGTLPFLFKVLSIQKPLSIQLHPHKSKAVELHAKDPNNYPDENHKPEMLLSLNRMKAMYNFQDGENLFKIYKRFSFLNKFVPPTKFMKVFLDHLFALSSQKKTELLQQMKTTLDLKKDKSKTENLFLRLQENYPQDIGLTFIFIMNHIKIPPYHALSIKCNQIHSYLDGDFIECMANSDNVIRAGITNKFKDTDELLGLVDFQPRKPLYLVGKSISSNTLRFHSDESEFEMHLIRMDQRQKEERFSSPVPEILLCLSGEAFLQSDNFMKKMKQGYILFVGANENYSIHTLQKSEFIRATVPFNS